MPKTPSKTSKKKKFNSRFPPARIKKIMQTDEEVGKVAAAVPVIISRALELFLESLLKETSETTVSKNAKTLSTSHIKHTIETNKQFDFLRDLVANLPDHNTEESNGDAMIVDNGEVPQKRKRGRPRKNKDPLMVRKKKGESSKASPETSEEEEDEEEEEDDEATESDDDDKARKPPELPSYVPAKSLATSAPVSIPLSDASSSTSSSSSSASLPRTAAQYNSGLANATTAGAQNISAHLPPSYSVPALSSVSNQQTQLQLHQQMQAHHPHPHYQHFQQQQQPPPPQQHQQQLHGIGSTSVPPASSLLHPFLPPAPMAKPALHTSSSMVAPPPGMDGYPIPPQFHSPYQVPGLMPPAHQPLPLQLHPGLARYPPAAYAGLPAHPDQGTAANTAQAHPINLSMVSQSTLAANNNADAYDS